MPIVGQARLFPVLNVGQGGTMAEHNERRERNAAHAKELRRTADTLDETRARLRQTGQDLRERGRELDRTGHIVRDVARVTEALRSSTPKPAPRKDDE
jgi:galactokinase